MSQDPFQDTQSRRPKRRSSIIQQAKKNGIIPDSDSMLRGLPETLQPSLLRLSSGHNRGSALLGMAKSSLGSIVPTPTMQTGSASRRPPTSKPSSIPRPNMSGAKKFMNSTTSSANKVSIARGKPLGPPKSAGAGGRKLPPRQPVGRPPLPVQHGEIRPSARAADNLSSLRRSTSMDSNAWQSNMMTPTPARSMGYKTPNSMRSWGSQSNLRTGQGFKVPGTKDTKVMVNITHYVHSYMGSLGYPNLPSSPLELRQISTNTYMKMVIALGERFLGRKFFMTTAKEDPINKIVELANVLKYPTAISKSHLKSANAQHAWPTCLTFLAWLCCRDEAAFAEEPEKPINDMLNEGFPQIALSNFLRVYEAERVQLNVQQVLDEELENFRITVSDQLMGELNASLEDLVAMKNEKIQELEAIANTPDPTKDVLEAIESKEELIVETKMKIKTAKEKIVLYNDIAALQAQSDFLENQIRTQQSAIQSLKSQIQSQPISRKMANKIIADTEEFQKERQCLIIMNRNLRAQADAKKSILKELDAKYREIVTKFIVVELYNTNLSHLDITGLSVPVNPLNPLQIDPWLSSAGKILEKTKLATRKLLGAARRDHQNYVQSIRRAEEQLIVLKRQLETKQAGMKGGTRIQINSEQKMKDDLAKLEDELKKTIKLVTTKEKEFDRAQKVYDAKELEFKSENAELQEALRVEKAWQNEREKCHAVYLQVRASIQAKFSEIMAGINEKVKQGKEEEKTKLKRAKKIAKKTEKLRAKLPYSLRKKFEDQSTVVTAENAQKLNPNSAQSSSLPRPKVQSLPLKNDLMTCQPASQHVSLPQEMQWGPAEEARHFSLEDTHCLSIQESQGRSINETMNLSRLVPPPLPYLAPQPPPLPEFLPSHSRSMYTSKSKRREFDLGMSKLSISEQKENESPFTTSRKMSSTLGPQPSTSKSLTPMPQSSPKGYLQLNTTFSVHSSKAYESD